MNTGMGNISNWETHEWTWRFHYPQAEKDWKAVLKNGGDTGYSDVYLRTQEIKSVYEAEDIRIAQAVFRQYDVDYVVLGAQERRSYPKVTDTRFDQVATLVYESEGTKLYKVNK